ncbi:MAG: AtpZ/AtpI family protein [Candidatus Magasanikbacteria bacterium]|nr:AtpZ/AtpI family protein [Candidatus Magasanikbacteria bacterium]
MAVLCFMSNKEIKTDRAYYLFGLKIASDFGASIAVPVVVFTLLGQWLDKKYGKGPLFLVIGFVVAAIISAKIIYNKAKVYGEAYKKMK